MALQAAGRDVHIVDLTWVMFQKADLPLDPKFTAAKGQGPGLLIMHVNGPWMAFGLLGVGRKRSAGKLIIGYWAWELTELPPEWLIGVQFVHEIWAPSRFTADAIGATVKHRPIRVLPHPVAASPVSAVLPTGGRPFTVLTVLNVSSGLSRKNPGAVLAAFEKAFGDDVSVRLRIKVMGIVDAPGLWASIADQARQRSNVTLIDNVLSRASRDALFQGVDVVISLHRAEGFGLVLAEAMVRGIPVVATGWSGNLEFMDDTNAALVPYRMVPARDAQGEYNRPGLLWADPDIDEAARALIGLRDEITRLEKGRRAARDTNRLLSPRQYVSQLDAYTASPPSRT